MSLNNTPAKLPDNVKQVSLQEHCKLIINEQLWNQINYLHKKPNINGLEWSGILLWNIKEGAVSDPSTLVIEANTMHLMDIGNAAYTEYELDPDSLMEMFSLYPQSDPMVERDESKRWYMGHIHTHHSMEAFFSGTDEAELVDNAPNNKYYLSLIVNYANKPVAKLCVTGKQEATQIRTTSVFGETVKEIPAQTVIYKIDCDIDFPKPNFPVGDEFSKRFEGLVPKPKPYSYPSYGVGFQQGLWQGQTKSQKEASWKTSPQIGGAYRRDYNVSYDIKRFTIGLLTLFRTGHQSKLLNEAFKEIARIKDENLDSYLAFLHDGFEKEAIDYFSLPDQDPNNQEVFLKICQSIINELTLISTPTKNRKEILELFRTMTNKYKEQTSTI